MLDGVQIPLGEGAVFGGCLAQLKSALRVTAAVYAAKNLAMAADCIAADWPVTH